MELMIIDSAGNSFEAKLQKGKKAKQQLMKERIEATKADEEFILAGEKGDNAFLVKKLKEDAAFVLKIDSEEAEKFVVSSKSYKKLKEEFDSIMDLSGELVTIVSKEGVVERVSSNCKEIMGIEVGEFVGKSIFELEKTGVITLSSTKRVLETLREVTLTQKTRANRRLYVRGIPMFNEDGALEKIINISRDITEESILRERLKETEREVELLMKEYTDDSKERTKIIAKSIKLEEVYYLLNKVAQTDATVLFLGETGVGKGVFSKHLHDASDRRNAPFIQVNCSVLPEHLIESELFGYVKGSFTGANVQGKKGLIEAADKGTLFLDEIGELPLQTQAKLLQVLQDKSFTPIGRTSPVKVDVRFVAATNKDLAEMVKNGEFRSDLYYRLNVVPVAIPPLRERQEDIPFLLQHFLNIFNAKYKRACQLSLEAIDQLSYYEWPGNVRELENLIERLVITSSKSLIDPEDLPKGILGGDEKERHEKTETKSLKEKIDEYEKKILIDTYKKSKNLNEMSHQLKVDTSTISRKLKKHHIDLH